LAWAKSVNLTTTKGEDEMDIFVLFLPVFWFYPPVPIYPPDPL